ncbi:MAG: hypothetical protein F4X22_06880 [Gemmatimonadales bacterium]|nr:hypothetical protein [Gemmatimonadales bacterium]MYC87946.1 hypothetical protein [Candidatus Palauibacter denitrificans]
MDEHPDQRPDVLEPRPRRDPRPHRRHHVGPREPPPLPPPRSPPPATPRGPRPGSLASGRSRGNVLSRLCGTGEATEGAGVEAVAGGIGVGGKADASRA